MDPEQKNQKKPMVMWNSWSSWSSPVGLGMFLLFTALAAAIVLYSLLNLAGAAVELAHSGSSAAMPTYSTGDPSAQDTMDEGTLPPTQ